MQVGKEGAVPVAAAVDGDKPSGPRSRKGIRTRARLVDAAKTVFEQSGFLDARISDIAEQAGLSHGSFYHYFESKEEIFRDVAGALEEQLGAHSVVDSGLLDETSGASMRERLTESNRRYLAEYRDEARIMGVIEQVSRYDEEVRAARLARQRQYTERTEVAIRRLQRQGLADSSLDPTIAAPALTAMVTRFAEMWFVQGQVDCSFDEGVEQLATLCMNALQVKDKAETRRGRGLKPTRHQS
ncbi:MAG: TetR/AcrR family transcriptional regulator [Acidimicrobiales bacterium]